MPSTLYCFYKNLPYIVYTHAYESPGPTVGLTGYWDIRLFPTVAKTDIEFVDESDIPTIFVQRCKDVLLQSYVGWSKESAIHMEKEVRDDFVRFLTSVLRGLPQILLEKVCAEKKYCGMLNLSEYWLNTSRYLIQNPCSDGQIRSSPSSFLPYIVDTYGLDVLGMFRTAYPFLKFSYDIQPNSLGLHNIHVTLPFTQGDVLGM